MRTDERRLLPPRSRMNLSIRLMSVAVAILLAVFGSIGDAAARKLALVIGNDAYTNLPVLQKAVNDGTAMARTLRAIGYDVLEGSDLTRRETNRLFSDLESRIEVGDEVFFYFAGHGVAIGSENYLIPTDMPRPRSGEEGLVRDEGHSVTALVERLQRRGAKTTILVLDACRNNPFEASGVRSIGRGAGLAETRAASGVFLLYSAGYGQAALDRLSDDDANPNSVFTRSLVPLLKTPGLSHVDVAKRVQQDVDRLARTVSHQQQPAYYDQILGEIVFQPDTDLPLSRGAAAAWDAVRGMESSAVFQTIIDRFDGTIYADFARARLQELRVNPLPERASVGPDRVPDSDSPPETDGLTDPAGAPDCGSIERASVGAGPCATPDAQDVAVGGDVDDLVRLAFAYRDGDGVARDARRAAELFRTAAEAGSVAAARHLGDLHWAGAPGLPADAADAVAWYRRAADADNDPASMTAIGIAYRTGRGVARDTEEATIWLRWAVGDATPVDLAGTRRLRAFPAASYGAGNRFEVLGRPVGILEIKADAGTMKCGALVIDENRIMTTRSCRYDWLAGAGAAGAEIRSLDVVLRGDGEDRRYPVDPDPLESDADLDFAIFETRGSPGRDFGTVRLAATAVVAPPVFRIIHPTDPGQIALSLQCTPHLLEPARPGDDEPCPLPWTAGAPLFDMHTDMAVAMVASPSGDVAAVPFARIAERSGIVAGLLEQSADRAGLMQLEPVRARGALTCGVAAEAAGAESILASMDAAGAWSGFDIDICRAIAAATLGRADAIAVVPIPVRAMETSLLSGEIDVFAGAYDVRLRGEGSGVAAAGTTLVDGLGFVTRRDFGIVSVRETDGATICLRPGTADEEKVAGYFTGNGMSYEVSAFVDLAEGITAYQGGSCDVLVGNVTRLAGAMALGTLNPGDHLILPETLTIDRRSPVVSTEQGEPWRDIVATIVDALIAAEEQGVSRSNGNAYVDDARTLDGERLGLRPDWISDVIAQVGNYGEIYAEHIGTPVRLPRGHSALAVDGGVIAAR